MGLISFLGVDNAQLAQRASLFHIAILDYNSANNSCLDVIFGAGVCYVEGKGISQTLLVAPDKTRLNPGFYNIREDDEIFALVSSALGGGHDWISDLVVHVTPTPEIQAKAGDIITSSISGTAGAGVTWNNGSGFLTAGHVAPQGSSVILGRNNMSNMGKIGTTRYCGYRVGTPNSPMADVSIVEIQQGKTFQSNLSGTIAAQAGETVSIHSNINNSTATIMGYCTFVHWPKTNATYGNCYFTTKHVTGQGYSGAAVSIPKTGRVVGMVVGGTTGFTTYIQDIDYIISSIPQSSTGLFGLSV